MLSHFVIQRNLSKMGTPQSGHSKSRQRFCPKFVVFWSNSVEINLYKGDNSIKRTLIYGPNGVHFKEILLYFLEW